MNHHRPVRAAIYFRLSSQARVETGTIAGQVVALRQRVHQDQIDLDDDLCFIDEGYGGSSLIRPALDRLRDRVAAGAVDRIYVHSPDRLARTGNDYDSLIGEFQRCGVEVVFLDQALEVGSIEEPH